MVLKDYFVLERYFFREAKVAFSFFNDCLADRSPYIFRNVLFMGCGGCIILSKCQTKRLRMPSFAPKYELVTGKTLLARFAKYTLTPFSCFLFPSVLFFLSIHSLPSVFLHGRTQFHTSEIVPLRPLKNGDRWLFSYGRTTTTVRTRPYDGSRSSVRSQQPVLSTVKRGSANAFFALETV